MFHAAREREPGERAAFLTEACRDDDDLRREVESLLAPNPSSSCFLEKPIIRQAVETIASQQSRSEQRFAPGLEVGPYVIETCLGAGGMGEVYRAKDKRLHRTVALKILRGDRMVDQDRRRRFIQEARAVSALNHPHIVVLYDILSERGSDVLVMEYLPGKTLDQVIPKRGISLKDALQYGIQIADALAAAHHAGIVHRDLKPGNIMISESGSVKLLDLGLAKLFEPPQAGEDDSTRAVAETPPLTEDGTILGTAGYMSPEQAEGKAVDARSDTFSFGCVLYEMATGQRAFQGKSRVSTLNAILHDEPRPASQVGQGIPHELERIITMCLRKDPGRRWQSMQDVRNALEELKEESDSGKLVDAEAPPRVASKRTRRWVTLSVVVVAAGAGAASWLARMNFSGAEEPLQFIQLTSYPGAEYYPSLSPDGNQVAFTWRKENHNEIYVKLIGPGDPLRLTSGPHDYAPSWSPDGRWIAFLRIQSPYVQELRVITALGGAERKLADLNTNTTPDVRTMSWSADSKWISCGDQKNAQGLSTLMLVSAESGEKQELLAARSSSEALGSPAISPDGKKLAFIRFFSRGIGELYVVALTSGLRLGGEPVQLTHDGEGKRYPAWTPDSKDIVFAAIPNGTLWRISASGHAERRRLGVGNQPSQPSISLRGHRLAYTGGPDDSNIWRVQATTIGRTAEPAMFISSTLHDESPQYSPDGKRIAFASDRSGSGEIWVTDSDGLHPVQITAFGKGDSGTPRWSPDSSRIVFDSSAEGKLYQIYTIDADGGKPKRLTEGAFENAIPSWSRDGKWIYFCSERTGRPEIWKVSPEGGLPRQVTRRGGFAAFESPDGKWLYFTASRDYPTSISRIDAGGGAATEVLKDVHPRNFAVSSRGIYYQAFDGSRMTFFDFVTKKSSTILLLRRLGERLLGPDSRGSGAEPGAGETVLLGLTVSPDEQWLLYAKVDYDVTDLMLIENFH